MIFSRNKMYITINIFKTKLLKHTYINAYDKITLGEFKKLLKELNVNIDDIKYIKNKKYQTIDDDDYEMRVEGAESIVNIYLS